MLPMESRYMALTTSAFFEKLLYHPEEPASNIFRGNLPLLSLPTVTMTTTPASTMYPMKMRFFFAE